MNRIEIKNPGPIEPRENADCDFLNLPALSSVRNSDSGVTPWVRLYLDVDGTLRAERAAGAGWSGGVVTKEIETPGHLGPRAATVTYAPALIQVLEALRIEEVEIVWLTTWLEAGAVEHFAREIEGLQNCRQLAIPMRDDSGGLPADWKYDEISRDQALEPGPYIWADDQDVPLQGERASADQPVVPKLLIAPEMEIGLTPKLVYSMFRFVRELNAQ